MSVRIRPALALVLLLSGCDLEVAFDISASVLSGGFSSNGQAFPANPGQSGLVTLFGETGGDIVLAGQTHEQAYEAYVVDGTYAVHYSLTNGQGVPANAFATVIEDLEVAGDAQIPIAIDGATVTATFTLNGGAFPSSQTDTARFYLRAVGSEDLVLLGHSHDHGGSATVIPGRYDVLYAHSIGPTVPANALSVVLADVVVSADLPLAVDVASRSVRTAVTLDGAPFPQSQYDDANLLLRDEVTGVETLLMNTHAPVPIVRLIPGTYDLIYRHETGTGVPLNTAAVVLPDFVVADGAALSHDITSVSVDLDVTLDGAPFPVSQYDDGIIALHDPSTDTDTELGNTHGVFEDLRLIPGTYDVLYSHETGDDVPQNVRGTVLSGVLVDGAPLAVDVVSVEVGANLTLDGSPFPESQYDDANLLLVGPATDGEILVGNTHDGVPTARVLAGTYDLIYRHETGDDVPQNTHFRVLTDQVLDSDTVLARDLVTHTVRTAPTLDGNPFPSNNVGSGRIWASSGYGDLVIMEDTGDVQHTRMLIAGEYDFIYQYRGGVGVPENLWVVVHHAVL